MTAVTVQMTDDRDRGGPGPVQLDVGSVIMGAVTGGVLGPVGAAGEPRRTAHGAAVGFMVGNIFSTLGSMIAGGGRRGRRAVRPGGPPGMTGPMPAYPLVKTDALCARDQL